MSRKTNATTVARNIVLKTIHDDIMRDNANATITTKKMRVWLRSNAAQFTHAHNASWTFTQPEYDIVRSHFDPKYGAKIARVNKRNTQSNDTPKRTRSRKVDVIADVADANARTSDMNANA